MVYSPSMHPSQPSRAAGVVALGTVLLLIVAAAAYSRPFTARDLAQLDRLSDPRVSPDGRYVAYDVRSTDWEANRGLHSLWVLERGSAESPRLIRDQEKAATEPRWSADGRWLYFLSSRSGSTQLWRTGASLNDPHQLTRFPLDIGFYRLSADGHTLVAAFSVFPDCESLGCTKSRDEAKAKDKTTGVVYQSIDARFWDSYLDGHYSGLYAASLEPDAPASEAVPLTRNYRADIIAKPDGDDSSFILSADGRTIYFSARPSGAAQGMGEPHAIYRVPADGSAPPARVLPESRSSDTDPALAPDGRHLAYLSQLGSVFTAPRSRLMVRDLQSGETHDLGAQLDRSASHLAWSPDAKTLYGLVEDTGQVRLFAFDASTGAAHALTDQGHVSSFDVSKSVLIYARDALDSPAEVFELRRKASTAPLTQVGADILATTPLSEFQQFAFPGWNGETVHGYLVKPAEFHADRKYPVAFLIHGGPHGSFGNAWSYRWNPQVWAGMGYAVVMVDFHGSSGYGEAFAKSIIGHWGDRPLEDLQKGWAYSLSEFEFLDGGHACALGGSYGGYMVAWIAGTWTQPWRCLVDHDGVFDIRLMSYSTDIPGFQQAQNDTPTWVNGEAVERFNPVDHVADWSVPILVVHGGRDDRVPLDQGMGAYGAAQLRHVPSELLYFPDENHWVLKPQNSVQWYATVEAWMKRWLNP